MPTMRRTWGNSQRGSHATPRPTVKKARSGHQVVPPPAGRSGRRNTTAISRGSILSRVDEIGEVIELAAIASDSSGLLRIRLVARVLTQIVVLLQALIAALAKRRKARSTGAPTSLQDAAKAVGYSDALVSRSEVYDAATGHTFVIWELGRWGQDPSRIEVLGRGQTLQDAVSDLQRGSKGAKRRWR